MAAARAGKDAPSSRARRSGGEDGGEYGGWSGEGGEGKEEEVWLREGGRGGGVILSFSLFLFFF